MDRRVLLLGIAICACACADTLGPPSTVAECSDFILVDNPASCSLSGHAATADASLTLAPFVGLSAHVTSEPIGSDPDVNPGAGTFVSVSYPFLITGGTAGEQVPILVATNLLTDASSIGHALGFASLVVTTSFGQKQIAVCTNNSCGTTDRAFSGTLSTTVLSGETVDTLQLEIEASSGDSQSSEWATAFADPMVFIDPNFAGANQFTVTVPDGVSNALAPVPEPSLVLPLAALTALILRRKTSA